MKFLLLNYEFPPLGGGAASATYHTARELVRRGHRVEILTSKHSDAPSEQYLDRIHIHRVFSWRHGVHDAGLIGAATYLLFAARRLHTLTRHSSFDCAHFFFSLPTGVLAPLWSRWTGCPYIVSLRGSDVPGYDGGIVLRSIHALLRPWTLKILSGASHVVANSGSLRKLARQSFPDVSISVITNGVCTETFRPLRSVKSDDCLRLLSVSRLVSRKEVQLLIRAMAHPDLSRCQVEIIGEGPLKADLERLAKRIGVMDRVVFAGRLHGETLARHYRAADCFVLPSTAESFSMSLLEAMASGLPVVAARTGGIPELVTDGDNGRLVEPGNLEALIDGLAWIQESKERRKRISRNNREKICANYSWEKIVDQYEKCCYLPAEPGKSVVSEERARTRNM